MTTRADFLAEILANPSDDTPRLVYSDWLTEQGDPYGEFIRLQIERESLPAGSSAAKRMRTRELKLQKEHGTYWAAGIPPLVERFEFRRGFVGWIKLDMRRFVTDAEQLVREAPIESLELRVGAHYIRKLAECEQLAQIRSLTVKKCRMKQKTFKLFVNSPCLNQLEHLELYRSNVTDTGCEALASSTSLNALRSLSLTQNRIGPQGASAIAQHMSHLKQLDLSSCWIEDSGASEIAATHWPNLQSLQLGYCHFRQQGVEAISTSSGFPVLKHLDLMHCSGQSHFAGPTLPALEFLNLAYHSLDDDDVMKLATSPHRSALRHLDLRWNSSLSSQAATHLAASPLLSQLNCLKLCFRDMTMDDAIRLAESPHLKRRSILHFEGMHPDAWYALRDRYGKSFGHFPYG